MESDSYKTVLPTISVSEYNPVYHAKKYHHQRLWTAHTTKFTWQGDSEARSNLQWYEIDVPSKTVVQQNGFGASGAYYFYPAIQTDLSRNAYLVFTRSSASQFADVRQTGRRVDRRG
jgi:hypothetical protein